MKKYFLFFLGLLLFISIASQAQNTCASVFNPQIIQSSDPNRYNRYIQLEQFIANYIASLNSGTETGRLINPNSTIIIPVVVHVLHNGEAIGVGNNISDAQIQSQIAVLNEDFRRLNADRVNTPAAFAGVAVDPNIEFRLACIDPNGNNTNGIHRVQTNINSFTVVVNANRTINEQASRIKFTAQGGTNAWATDRYLNMWVCNITPDVNGQILGYAQFPFDYATSPNTDGVVILNTAFGRVGNLRFQYDRGRTTSHEVGHWLNLFHIWGDDEAACTGSDQCDDTPNQGGANQSNCPGFPHVSCTNGPNGDMFMNYMDYTIDGCKNIYTQGQTNRMRAIFTAGGLKEAFINNYFHVNPRSTPICTNGQVSATNLPCLPITWSVISGPVSIQSGQNTNIVTLQKNGDGVATIRATAGGYLDEIQLSIGKPKPGPITTVLVDYHIGKIQVQIDPVPGATSYNWYKDGVLQTISHGTFAQIPITKNLCNIGYGIEVEAINNCGTSAKTYKGVYVPCDDDFYKVSPNPAESYVNISVDESKVQNASYATFDEVRIYDFQGTLKKYQQYNKVKTAQINIAGLTNGNYFIEVTSGAYKEQHQLLIQK